ncbi:MAG: DUF6169 family protein [Ruminococcus sp.]|nr:DUF6169 family protein [Ruminococcus sp.]
MVTLDLNAINAIAPYKVTAATQPDTYLFRTDFGVAYKILFVRDDLLQSEKAYHLYVIKLNNLPSPSDIKVKHTILAVLKNYFLLNNSTLLYICDTGDNKQASRNRLFKQWFNTFSDKENYICIDSKIKDENGIDNYAAMISRLDNPNLENTIQEFVFTVKCLSEKPQ